MKSYEVIIVGAGAAGLMTAIQAAEGGLRVLLLEGQKKVGAKILMSGGTRCNVTNKTINLKDYNSQAMGVVRNVLNAFDNEDTIQFFKELGVDLILEPTGKYFPLTNSGKTVLEALLRKLDSLGVKFLLEHKVKALAVNSKGFILKGDAFEYESTHVVLTTGGLSYPTTGSDGTGYRLAQSVGHGMTETCPALTPLISQDKDLKALSGITVEVVLNLWVDGKKQKDFKDSFLFTHAGFSGPAALDMSRHWLMVQGKKEITANFCPQYNEDSLSLFFKEISQHNPRKIIRNILTDLLPQRLVDVLLQAVDIVPSIAIGQLDKTSRQRLVKRLVYYPLEVTGVLGYSKAEVTAGGIDFASVNPRTLESQLAKGLYFAGEILDVDGRIGGFNFQWAWSSGYVVAQSIISKEKTHEQENH